MRAIFSQLQRALGVLGLAGAVFLGETNGAGQARRESASDLIKFLTYQADRPGKSAVMVGLLGCGHFQEDRAAARSLVGLGAAATAELERALDSLEQSGENSAFSFNAGWLLEAYARINGSQAYPRLQRMMGSAKLGFLQDAVDTSTAVSLGLTSYVHASRTPTKSYHCGRSEEPRDALDRLVLAWLRADRPRVEDSLGSEGATALKRMLGSEDRPAAGVGLEERRSAVGYRFQGASGWVDAAGLIGGDAGDQNALPSREIYTLFTSASGKSCGAYTVRFAAEGPEEGGARRYAVNNPDLAGLLSLITNCAAMLE